MDAPATAPEPTARRHSESARGVELALAFPWWLGTLALAAIIVGILIATTPRFGDIFDYLRNGVSLTLTVSIIAYSLALMLGLVIGLARANAPRPGHGRRGWILALLKLALYNLATLYVQVMRGLPVLVTLFIVAFLIVPEFNALMQRLSGVNPRIPSTSPQSAIVALSLTYAAFLSETMRAGIQSVGRGQVEAARSLGMTYGQVLRYIVLPQALRRVLPPLGNDMIAMIKDSSLVAVLGINDITQLAKLYASSSFRTFETYLIAALIYLLLTIPGSMAVRYIERRFPVER